MKQKRTDFKVYAISILISLGVGAFSAFVTKGNMAENSNLIRPPLAPPGWVFPVVWTILFVLMGVSAAIVYRSKSPEKTDALFVYGTQLVVNCLWTIFYFNFEARLLAFFWLLFLLALVMLMTNRFRRISRLAGNLQIPYIIWLLFAGYLNLMTYLLNG